MKDKKILRVLVVEDDPSMQALLQYLLKPYFELDLVESIDEALVAATRQRFDLFVLDIDFHEQRTGVDLLGALRQMEAYDATPAVACTSYDRQSDTDHFLSRGFDNHLGKPFTREQLFEAIDTTLARVPDLPAAA